MWSAKIPFLFGACVEGSLILLVSATLVRAKITPWISSVEGRWVPSHRSEAFHRTTLTKAICRRWWSLAMRTTQKRQEEKQGTKGGYKPSESIQILLQFQVTLLETFTPPHISPKPENWTDRTIAGPSLFLHITVFQHARLQVCTTSQSSALLWSM